MLATHPHSPLQTMLATAPELGRALQAQFGGQGNAMKQSGQGSAAGKAVLAPKAKAAGGAPEAGSAAGGGCAGGGGACSCFEVRREWSACEGSACVQLPLPPGHSNRQPLLPQVLGFDVMFDTALRPWLIEVSRPPLTGSSR